MTTFFGLEIGRRSVMTQRTGLEITGHNIANANTPGFSRQAPNMVTTSPYQAPMLNNGLRIGQLGTGVDITEINRIRDEFLDAQIRKETQTTGYWDSMQQSMARIEAILNEPSEDGLRGVMDQFWESWEDLSVNAESESVRSVVVQRGLAMAEAFNHTYRQLEELRVDINDQIKIKAVDVNSTARQIAALNKQISIIDAAGKQPNDLMDKRDLLLKQLSEIAEVRVVDDKNKMIGVQLGDRMLVQGVDYQQLDVEMDKEGMYMLLWSDTQTKARINGGELRGMLDVRGQTLLPQENSPSEYKELIPNMIDDLNTLAKTLIVKVNEIHRGGYSLNNKTGVPDGENFFNLPDDSDTFANWAEFMNVSRSIQDDVKNVAAASRRTWDNDGDKVNFGDGSNALEIAQLKHDLNNPVFSVKTEGLNIDFSSHQPLTFLLDDGNGIKEIEIAPPYTFPDMERLAEALQNELTENEIAAQVRCEGGEIVFYSKITRNLEIIYPDSGITDLQSAGLQNGEYQLQTRISTPGAHDANLTLLQSYNQKTAGNIFGIGSLQATPTDQNLDINASIEVTISDVNSYTGEISYSYISHEYNRDGSYSRQTGGFTIRYGGADTQFINIGSLTAEISGLSSKSPAEALELRVGDKGVLGLTAATAAATQYQSLGINYNFNSPREVSQNFVFDDGVLDLAASTKQINFFTLNNNQESNLCGELYDGYIQISNETLLAADTAAYLSYYEGAAGDSGMVRDATSDDYWRSLTANTGVVSQESQRMLNNQIILLAQLENKWESISGVSLDEEMTNMIKFQHAYNAAARFITGIDEAIDVIVNRMGLVGR